MAEIQDIGINTAIVGVLRKYKKEIPVDYLAKEVGRRTYEIQGSLKNLVDHKIVKIHNDFVSILES